MKKTMQHNDNYKYLIVKYLTIRAVFGLDFELNRENG